MHGTPARKRREGFRAACVPRSPSPVRVPLLDHARMGVWRSRTPFARAGAEEVGWGIAARRRSRAPIEEQTRPPFMHKRGRDQGGAGGTALAVLLFYSTERGRGGMGSAHLLGAALHSPFTQRRGGANPAHGIGRECSRTRGAQGGMQTQFACHLSLFTPVYRVVHMGGRGRGCRREEEGREEGVPHNWPSSPPVTCSHV